MATNQPINATINAIQIFDDIATQVTSTFDQLIDQLIARRDTLLRELQEIKDKYLTQESTRKEAMEELIVTQQRLGEMSLKVNQNREFHQMNKDFYQQRIDQLSSPTKLTQRFFSCPQLHRLQTLIDEFGEVIEWEIDYSQKKQPVLAVGKRGKANNELNAAVSLALDEPNQLIYIADCDNNRIQVVLFDGKFLNNFGQDVLQLSWGIAVTDNHIFVTDYSLHALSKFSKKEHKLVKRTGTQGSEVGQLDHPSGLCIDFNGEVYVADSENHRISIFSSELNFLRCITSQQLISPRDVKATLHNIIVLDHSPYCLHFFSRSSELLKSCVRKEKDGVVLYPFFFCLDPVGNIIMTDVDRHAITILSHSGQLMHRIRKKGHRRGELYRPFGISISQDGTIFVISQNPNFVLQAF